MPIRIYSGAAGGKQWKMALRKNWKHYVREGSGLAIFMVSACLFNAMLFSANGSWHRAIPGEMLKNVVMGVLMGATALFIFYSRWTAPSGSQINPAVTITFLRMGKMCRYDALFFIICQFAGGTIAVYLMQFLLGNKLTAPPVNSSVTIPGEPGTWWALLTEFTIAFVTMGMVLFTSQHDKLKKYTRIIAAILVCCWVILAGPVSGFGMNPARSFASALPAGIWTGFWIYLFVPVAGMLAAAEFFLIIKRKKTGIIARQEPIPIKHNYQHQ
jgi:aquaporin Z